MRILPLQLDGAVSALLDYGLIGVLLIIVGYFAWHLYRIQEQNSREWKQEAKESAKLVFEMSTRQSAINEKQVELQKQGNDQTKSFYDSMSTKIDAIPERIMKEIQYNKLVDLQNNKTSSDGSK